MNMREIVSETGIPAKTIRYYESAGLIRPSRQANGYRDFSERDLDKLVFLSRARHYGFTVDECRQLALLYDDESRTCAAVRKVADECLERIERQVRLFSEMKAKLARLIEQCPNDASSACPIIDELAGEGPEVSMARDRKPAALHTASKP